MCFFLILFEYIYRLYGVMVNMFALGALARGFGSSQEVQCFLYKYKSDKSTFTMFNVFEISIVS
jgi:hypothetical protein